MKYYFSLLLCCCFNSLLFAQYTPAPIGQLLNSPKDSFPIGTVISMATIEGENVRFYAYKKEKEHFVLQELEDSLFEIASITKVFTSTLLAKAIVTKKVKANQTINKAFRYRFHNKIKLTYQSLSNHSSGVPRLPTNQMTFLYTKPQAPYEDYSYKLLDQYLKKELQLLSFTKPIYAYSNLGAGLLAYALSKKLKGSTEELFQEYIFTPYQLKKTAYNQELSFPGIGPGGSKVAYWDFNALKGAGGLVSTAKDLSKFIQAQFNPADKALSLSRQKTLEVGKDLDMAMGWHIFNPGTVDEYYFHNGATGGSSACIVMRPDSKKGVVLLSNLSALHPSARGFDALCLDLLNSLK